MPSPQDAFRVLAITSNDSLLEQIKSALSQDQAYFFIDRRLKANELMESIESLQPNCVLLDFAGAPSKPLEMIDSLSWQFPDTAVVVALPQEQMAEANRVILAGARAFIAQPLDPKELLDAVGRIREVYERGQHSRASAATGEVPMTSRGTFVVFSPKGGVGCSLVAVNLALALKAELKQDVLLMDGKLLFGDLDIMLNLQTQNSIADLMPHIGSLDEGLIRDVVSEHVSGVKVLPAPPSPTSAQGIHPEDLHRILTSVQNIYPNIVIDGGNFLNDNAVTLMDASHRVLLVINPDIACLRGASRFLDLCRTTLSFPRERILLILNQHDQREGLSRDDIERSLQTKVFATLPSEPRVALQSINRGVPLGMLNQHSQLRKAVQALAKDIGALAGAKVGAAPAGKKKMPEVLSRSSRLG
ncbi:MAG: AAA family ATPase [Chloroflexota bacterium]